MNNNNLKVEVNLCHKSPKIISTAKVLFGDSILTQGWRMMPSNRMHPVLNNKIWIQAPSFMVKNDYIRSIIILDKDLRKTIEKNIFEKTLERLND